MPIKRTQLSITGYRDETTPHTFFQQDTQTTHAALILPGIGYTCQQPVLYYPTIELQNQGADVLWVEYNQRPYYSSLSQNESVQCATTDTISAYQALMQHHSYQQITIIGKSLGTFVMTQLLKNISPPSHTTLIWLTPVIGSSELRTQIINAAKHHPSLFVIGTHDHHYSVPAIEEVQEHTKGTFLVIDYADHSMEISGNTLQSIEAQIRTIQTLQEFMGTTHS